MDRRHRLSSPAEFSRVLEHGTRAASRTVTCFLLTLAEDRPARVGVTATRRLGSSVARNLAKRRLREAIRPCLPAMAPGTDVVLVARQGLLGSSFQQLRSDVVAALSKVGVAC